MTFILRILAAPFWFVGVILVGIIFAVIFVWLFTVAAVYRAMEPQKHEME